MSATLISLQTDDAQWVNRGESIIVGKDILEILSSAMYVDPLAIYREYVQNSADAIDEARQTGVLRSNEVGAVAIELDISNRVAKIRDNGTGIPASQFETQMTAFGASAKRGRNARGFRGVGRLSGLAYCQELLFRSRFAGEPSVSELRWDCRKTKALLSSADFAGDLAAVVSQSVQVRQVDGRKWPEHFFEVELRGITRLRSDCLLNPEVIEEYLSQVAPLPFDPRFRFGEDITEWLQERVGLGSLSLIMPGKGKPTFRPHRNSFDVSSGTDTFQELQKIDIPGTNGGIAAVGWILHHGYKGAVPEAMLKGLRLRSGDIQIGTSGILEDLFTETRFNSWCVGEVHVIDGRIVPNGRRDHFEQNVHFSNLINHLSPIAREISNRCRTSSMKRNWLRQFELQQSGIADKISAIKQGSLTRIQRKQMEMDIAQAIGAMHRIAGKEALRSEAKTSLVPVLKKVERRVKMLRGRHYVAKPLAALPASKRAAYKHVLSLVYECSPNRSVAKSLVDKMLSRL